MEKNNEDALSLLLATYADEENFVEETQPIPPKSEIALPELPSFILEETQRGINSFAQLTSRKETKNSKRQRYGTTSFKTSGF
jgi:hypothetical protein